MTISHHVLKKVEVRRGYTIPNPLTWPFNKEIRWHIKVSKDMLSGWLQRTVGDQICRDPPARGHHTGIICLGFLPPMGATGERPDIEVTPPLEAPLLTLR